MPPASSSVRPSPAALRGAPVQRPAALWPVTGLPLGLPACAALPALPRLPAHILLHLPNVLCSHGRDDCGGPGSLRELPAGGAAAAAGRAAGADVEAPPGLRLAGALWWWGGWPEPLGDGLEVGSGCCLRPHVWHRKRGKRAASRANLTPPRCPAHPHSQPAAAHGAADAAASGERGCGAGAAGAAAGLAAARARHGRHSGSGGPARWARRPRPHVRRDCRLRASPAGPPARGHGGAVWAAPAASSGGTPGRRPAAGSRVVCPRECGDALGRAHQPS